MNTRMNQLAVIALLAGTTILPAAAAETQSKSLLSGRFDPRPVAQVDIGDFHFAPGQLAPMHTHEAPVFGYVAKGAIYYQVEGREPQILNTGDAFYEPVGPNILHFDNASKTEEAIFVDFNFEREGDPFIVFPKPPTERIDRRSLPSSRPEIAMADSVQVIEKSLAPSAKLATPKSGETVYAYVAQGAVIAKSRDEVAVIYQTGQTFIVPKSAAGNVVANASKLDGAKLITFVLKAN